MANAILGTLCIGSTVVGVSLFLLVLYFAVTAKRGPNIVNEKTPRKK